jgi:hypothetical protein
MLEMQRVSKNAKDAKYLAGTRVYGEAAGDMQVMSGRIGVELIKITMINPTSIDNRFFKTLG